MLQKIIDFLKSIFSFLGGSKKEKKQEGPNKDHQKKVLPPVDELMPQDGSEIEPDTAVIIVNELEPAIFEETGSSLMPTEIVEDEIEEEEKEEKPEDPEKEEEKEEEAKPASQSRYLWCLDNGHGKQTAGKRSPVFDDGETQFFEYEFNRDIVKRIIHQLDELGIQYYNVVPEVDVDNFLKERVERANDKESALPKLFVSVHSNAAPTPSSSSWAEASISGIETWFFHTSKKGRLMASVFQRYLVKATGWGNRHIKSRPNRQFYVLANTSMPAVLTENGFYNNKAQALDLMKDEVRQQIADAHVKAIKEIEEKGLGNID